MATFQLVEVRCDICSCVVWERYLAPHLAWHERNDRRLK